MKAENDIRARVKKWGSIKRFADLLGAQYNTVSTWCRGFRAPAEWQMKAYEDALKYRTLVTIWRCKVCGCETEEQPDGIVPGCVGCKGHYQEMRLKKPE